MSQSGCQCHASELAISLTDLLIETLLRKGQFELGNRTCKLVYRQYASLYFVLCVDDGENELAYFEAIHLFVMALDAYFGNVCELDLVFHFNKVYCIADEYILGGEVQETALKKILEKVRSDEKAVDAS